jgi:hypothetical protein
MPGRVPGFSALGELGDPHTLTRCDAFRDLRRLHTLICVAEAWAYALSLPGSLANDSTREYSTTPPDVWVQEVRQAHLSVRVGKQELRLEDQAQKHERWEGVRRRRRLPRSCQPNPIHTVGCEERGTEELRHSAACCVHKVMPTTEHLQAAVASPGTLNFNRCAPECMERGDAEWGDGPGGCCRGVQSETVIERVLERQHIRGTPGLCACPNPVARDRCRTRGIGCVGCGGYVARVQGGCATGRVGAFQAPSSKLFRRLHAWPCWLAGCSHHAAKPSQARRSDVPNSMLAAARAVTAGARQSGMRGCRVRHGTAWSRMGRLVCSKRPALCSWYASQRGA